MIVVGTPLNRDNKNSKKIKEYFKVCNGLGENYSKLTYTIRPDDNDYEKAEKYPERRNEILGQWID